MLNQAHQSLIFPFYMRFVKTSWCRGFRYTFCGVVIVLTFSNPVLAGPEKCESGGGPTVCVQFDNLSSTPEEDVDYKFEFTDPANPDVQLKKGANQQGTMYEWRVWSKNAQGAAADIGTISGLEAYNYSVKIFNPSDQPGASNVGAVTLSPPTGHFSNVAAWISGSVQNGVTVKPDLFLSGGEANLEISGTLGGNCTIFKATRIHANYISGTVFVNELAGSLQAGHDITGTVTIQFASLPASGFSSVNIGDPLSGTLSFLQIADGGPDGGHYEFFLCGIASTGTLKLGQLGYHTFIFGSVSASSTCPMAGTIRLTEGIPNGAGVVLSGPMTGTIDFNDVNGLSHTDIETGGILQIAGGGTGQIINGGFISGTLSLGDATLTIPTLFSGSASFDGVTSTGSVPGSVTINGTGELEFSETFNGNICGTGLSDTEPILIPSNITMAAIGPQGTICGTAVCGSSPFSADPSGINKTRFISFIPSATDPRERAIGVRLLSLHHVDPPYTGDPTVPFSTFEGQVRYVGPPQDYVESTGSGIPFKAAELQCTAHYQDWSNVGLIHVYGSAIVPSSQYDVELLVGNNAACSTTRPIATTRWGDIVDPFNPPSTTVQPNFLDVSALLDKFKDISGAPIKARTIISPSGVFGNIDISVLGVNVGFTHIAACVDAFKGKAYPAKMGKCANRICSNSEATICTIDADCPFGGVCNAFVACTSNSECDGASTPCKLYCPSGQ